MLFEKKSILFLAAAFAFYGTGLVHAQEDTDTDAETATAAATQSVTSTTSAAAATGSSSVDPCLLECAANAASIVGCSSDTDVDCICSSVTFQSDALSCIQDTCSPEVMAQATALHVQVCSAVGSASATGSGTSRNVASTGVSTRSTTSSSVQHTSTTTSAAGSSATGSSESLASAGSELTVQISNIMSIIATFAGIVFGALAI